MKNNIRWIVPLAVVVIAGVAYLLTAPGGLSLNPGTSESTEPDPTIGVPADLRAVTGTVERVEGSTFMIRTDPLPVPQENWVEERRVTVTEFTSIIARKEKTQEEIAADKEKYDGGNPDPGLLATSAFTPGSMEDIWEGARVTVNSEVNLYLGTDFTATAVFVE